MESEINEDASASDAIGRLYELYSQDIYRYAWYSLGSNSKAEDVVQEVFFRAFRSWHSFRHDSNPRTWLMSITRNYLYDMYRKQSIEKSVFQDSVPDAIVDESMTIHETVDLESALAHMKQTHRQAIILRYIHNLSIRETSQVLGWSEARVRSTSHRAIIKLRKYLGLNDEGMSHRDI
ncbi:RNA polymerase sigma factor [Alicyclobacillus sp. SO9]|uniref:RNA polymerase sigma factor n=1 Tax=Alicyclobacillus sp. SO9 TaxID=2665646 RepID=UPI0018E8011C|nr:RNA polymerase sigma factor [Alicyclobacillus sp. SO9]QQE79864.1 RNA polymerase sigma factor [Alicyclobacillus sp. SO9]